MHMIPENTCHLLVSVDHTVHGNAFTLIGDRDVDGLHPIGAAYARRQTNGVVTALLTFDVTSVRVNGQQAACQLYIKFSTDDSVFGPDGPA
jgi:hypothetical protein